MKAPEPAEALTDMPQGPPRRRARRPLFILGIVLAVLSALALTVGVALEVTERRLGRVTVLMPHDQPGETWLVLGSDEREGLEFSDSRTDGGLDRDAFIDGKVPAGARADVVVVVHREGDTVSTVSIPRDLAVVDSRGMPYRLTLVALEGEQQLIDTLCLSLGVAVDHLAVLRMDGFAHVVDAAGGIEVTLDSKVNDKATGVRLDAGTHHIDGETSLALIRSRHSGSDSVEIREKGTIRRASMASDLFGALGRRIGSPWRHPIRASRAGWTLTGALTVDDATTTGDLRRLLSYSDSGSPTVLSTEPIGDRDRNDIPVRRLTEDAASELAAIGTGSGSVIPKGDNTDDGNPADGAAPRCQPAS